MALDAATKQALINNHQQHTTDTGSAPVQVAMLSRRINELSQHLQQHRHDYASRQGLLKMIGRRKRLLSYVKRHDQAAHQSLLKTLKLRG